MDVTQYKSGCVVRNRIDQSLFGTMEKDAEFGFVVVIWDEFNGEEQRTQPSGRKKIAEFWELTVMPAGFTRRGGGGIRPWNANDTWDLIHGKLANGWYISNCEENFPADMKGVEAIKLEIPYTRRGCW